MTSTYQLSAAEKEFELKLELEVLPSFYHLEFCRHFDYAHIFFNPSEAPAVLAKLREVVSQIEREVRAL